MESNVPVAQHSESGIVPVPGTALVGGKAVGEMLGICGWTVYNWCKKGLLPAPDIDGGRGKLRRAYWVRQTILDWQAAGCPCRSEWEKIRRMMQAQAQRR